MNIIFDYDTKKKQGIISSQNLDMIREHFSIANNNAKYTRRYNPYYPTRRYVITPTGRFDIGLIYDIIKFIKSQNIPYEITITDILTKELETQIEYTNLYKINLELRDYQLEAVIRSLKYGKGIIVLPTGAGKTAIIATLSKTILDTKKFKKCLIIVPSLQLVSQTYEDFIEYGINKSDVTKWSGEDEPNFKAPIIIANSSILLSDKQDKTILSKIDYLIIDEVHKIKLDTEISKLLKQINTNNRFGFTGTLPEDQIDEWNIIGKIGPVLYKEESKTFRDSDYISNILIKILKIKYKESPIYSNTYANPTDAYNVEYDFIKNNEFRNELITKLADKLDKNCLILVDRIDHGNIIKNILQQFTSKKVYFIYGDMELEEREKIKNLMENNNNIICIAMGAIFSTGINIKNIHYIIFTFAGKAKVKIIQSIGRGVRLHKDKVKLIVYDIVDCLKYSLLHLDKRINLYAQEKIEFEIKEIDQN